MIELIEKISFSDIESMQNIEKLCVIGSASDVNSALQEGAVLLGIATIKDDEEWDSFRFCIGLPKGIEVSPFLLGFF